jgi:2-keto-4-pentenoate hydratase
MTDTQHSAALAAADVAAIGAALFDAFESGQPIDPLTAAHPALSVEDAYRIQRELVAHHERAGRTVVGRKIGLTSLAMQQQLGIDSPDFGVVFDSHTFASGASIARASSTMIAPKLEPELAVVLEHELAGPGITAGDVRGALRGVLPVFEIIDSRVRDWKITLSDTVADNASCYGVVEGDEVGTPGSLADAKVSMSRHGDVLQRGLGTAVMGDPLEAVAWLANALGRLGDTLPADQPVLCGSFTAAVDATPGSYLADFGPEFGSVALEIAR